jgi:hypothetical protein
MLSLDTSGESAIDAVLCPAHVLVGNVKKSVSAL